MKIRLKLQFFKKIYELKLKIKITCQKLQFSQEKMNVHGEGLAD